MDVLALYQAPVRWTGPDESLFEAADRMAFYEVGSLAVMEHGRLVGIITERDLVHAIDEEVNLYVTRVADYMSGEPVSISPEDDLADAIRVMVTLGVRHLPVIEHGAVVGMISVRDLLTAGAVEAAVRAM